MLVELFEYPTNDDWAEVRRRALVTIGKKKADIPTKSWKEKILKARHSPIRRLHFAFYIECPYWVSVHLVRHVHSQPYVKSQRNDRQNEYDRNKAPQDEMVCMIWDMNAEELITICNKRLCKKASPETRQVVMKMRKLVIENCPEFMDELVPMCEREGGCHEMKPCYEEKLNGSK